MGSPLIRAAERQFRCGQVFDRRADALENRQRLRSRAFESARRKIRKFTAHGACGDDSSGNRAQDLARFTESAGSGVDIELAARDRFVIDLAHVGRERPDQIEMLSGLEPAAENERLPRERRAAHDVGPARGRLEIEGGLRRITRFS